MSKRLLAALSSTLVVMAITVFGLSNASALANVSSDAPLSAPASSAVDYCKEAQANFNIQKGELQAKALSTEMSRRELQAQLKLMREQQVEICKNAIY